MREGGNIGIAKSRAAEDSPHGQTLANLGVKDRLVFVGRGAAGALIGSLCCLLPAVAIAIGMTGGLAVTLVSLGRFRLFGLIIGFAFVAFTSWLSVRRRRSCCTEEQYKQLKITVPLTMLISFGAVYMLIAYLFIPLLYEIG